MTIPLEPKTIDNSATASGDIVQTPRRPKSSLIVLGLILAAFVVMRFPVLWRQPGGIDEEYYAIPGLTIWQSGIPQLPHVPQRDAMRVFYLADQALFAEPPLSFYWQALFYGLLPDRYGAARVASAIAALGVIWLVYELGRLFYRSETAALWAAGLCSVARSFYFPAVTARPDMLCTFFGLAALLLVARFRMTGAMKSLVLSGVCLGLAGLTHPLAIVPAIQAAVWLAFTGTGWRRITHPALLAGIALSVFGLWTPFIIQHPEAFRAQFFNNILGQAGPRLLTRLVLPWESLSHHAWMMKGHLGPIQYYLFLGGLVAAGVLELRSRARSVAWLLAASSIYLVSTTAGLHPTQYFWCYPTALLSITLGRAAAGAAELLHATGRRGTWLASAGAVVLIGLMLPGAGLRTWVAHLRHWNDRNYDAPAFAAQILSDFPPGARYTVDREFVLDFVAAGRRTLIAECYPYYFSAENHPYEYLVLSRYGLEENVAEKMNGELIRTYGNRDDLFSCYAEVYRPARHADEDNE